MVGRGTVIATTFPILLTPLYRIIKILIHIAIKLKSIGMRKPPMTAGPLVTPKKVFRKNPSAFVPHLKSREYIM